MKLVLEIPDNTIGAGISLIIQKGNLNINHSVTMLDTVTLRSGKTVTIKAEENKIEVEE